MDIVNAEGWKAVYLVDTDAPHNTCNNDLARYFPCGLGAYLTDVKVWVENVSGEESVIGLDLEPLYEGYSGEDLDWSPDTVPGFVGYLPPGASLSFLDKRAIMVSQEVNGTEWVSKEVA